MGSIFDYFLLNEGRTAKEFRFITANEFEFLYNCVDSNGRYSDWITSKDKNKLINKIVNYLNVDTTFSNEFSSFKDCEEARRKNIEAAGGDKRRKNYIKGDDKKKKEGEDDVQLFCDAVPKFMNELVPLLFNNINDYPIEDKSRLNEFISLHIDVFVNFFENRHREHSKELPRNLLYQQLVDVYMSKPFKKVEIPDTSPKEVITKSGKPPKKPKIETENLYIFELEKKDPNHIYKLYNYVLSGGNSKKNIGYLYDCTKKNEPIDKLLCVLTHDRDFAASFAFEKTFEHTTQFRPYKGNISFNLTINNLNTEMKKNESEEKDSNIKLDNTIKKLYVQLFNIIFTDKDMIDLFTKCLNPIDASSNNVSFCYPKERVLETLEEKLSDELGILLKTDNDKKAKGDIKAIKPVYSCNDNSSVVIKPNSKIELKFFTLDEIKKKKNNLHITRILEPDRNYIFSNIVDLPNFDKKTKEFNVFFDLTMNSIIKVVQNKVIEFKKEIERFSRPTSGLFISGPKFIPKDDDWNYDIYTGSSLQRGEGVGIKLQLPPNFKAYDLEYNYENRQFCVRD